jgi:hypothetical protein
MEIINLAESLSKLWKISSEKFPTIDQGRARYRVYKEMKGVLEAAARSLRAIQVRNMFQKLTKVKIGTKEVEEAARRVVGPGKKGRDEKEVVRILKRRTAEMEERLKSAKTECGRKRRMLPREVREEFRKIEGKVRSIVWIRGNRKNDVKIRRMKEKS